MTARPTPLHVSTTLVLLLLVSMAGVSPASGQQAQQDVNEVLAFLLTSQSVQTGDFIADRAAAEATSQTLSRALLVDLATMPLGSSSGGFTYQFNPTLGTLERRSTTFGPFFVERALGVGMNRLSLGLAFQHFRFDRLDDNDLRDGSFVTTANQFTDENEPFDTDALTLRMQSSAVSFTARYGIVDRLDIGAVVPFVSLTLNGQRMNTYRGQSVVQAVASASRMGLGDIGLQAKYQAIGRAGSGFAVAGDVRLPTGRSEDLLGAGRASVGMLAVGSIESGPVAVHVNGGYSMGGISDEMRFGAAVAVAAAPNFTVGSELVGRWLLDVGRIIRTAFPHPSLVGVNTYRLLPSGGSTTPVFVAGGFKWNIVDEWVLDAHVVIPVSNSGLTAGFTPAIALERSFGR